METKLLDSGECEATVNLNRAYAGLGRTTWTVYAIQASASDDVIKESFPTAASA